MKTASVRKARNAAGFTLIELVITIAILGVLGTVAVSNLAAFNNRRVLLGQAQRLESVLRSTQDRAVSEEGGTAWGVKIWNQTSGVDYYEVFSGNSYAGGTVAETFYLPGAIEFAVPTSGNSTEIVFARSLGTTAATYIDMKNNTGTDGHRIALNSLGAAELIKHGYGLVGYWRMDEGSGTTAIDVSGEENHGTISGATVNQTGQVGKAYSFAGSCSKEVSINSSDLNFTTGSFTVMMWVNQSTITANGRVFSTGSYQVAGYEVFVDDRVEVRTNQSGAVQATLSTANQLTTATWYHVAVTRSGATVKTYVNGKDETETSGNHVDPVGSTPAYVGRYYGSTSSYCFDGLIDEARVYNRALSQSEIVEIYNETR